METKVTNKIKIRNISPIKRNKEEIHTINQNTVTSNKSTNYATKTKTNLNSMNGTKYNTIAATSLHRTKYPKNINEYKHLMNNFQMNQADLDWTLYLRNYKPNKKFTKFNPGSFNPPTFYEDDFSKYQTRSQMNRTGDPFLLTDNTFKLSHLVKRTIDHGQLNFETTLRSFKIPKGVKVVKHTEEWKAIPNNPISKIEDNFLPPLTEQDQHNLNKIDKFVLRRYVPKYEKGECDNKEIRKKVMIPDKKTTLDKLGEHLSLDRYNQNYDIKNIQGIRHILGRHSNSMAHFEIGLRGGYEETSRTVSNKRRMEKINKKSIMSKLKKE